jgi:hypothetical protein
MPSAERVLMQGYRARAKDVEPLPKTLDDVRVTGASANTIDGKPYYIGSTEKYFSPISKYGK